MHEVNMLFRLAACSVAVVFVRLSPMFVAAVVVSRLVTDATLTAVQGDATTAESATAPAPPSTRFGPGPHRAPSDPDGYGALPANSAPTRTAPLLVVDEDEVAQGRDWSGDEYEDEYSYDISFTDESGSPSESDSDSARPLIGNPWAGWADGALAVGADEQEWYDEEDSEYDVEKGLADMKEEEEEKGYKNRSAGSGRMKGWLAKELQNDDDDEEIDEEESRFVKMSLHDPAAAWHIPVQVELSDSTFDADAPSSRVLMCALDWAAYRAGPSVYPFFDDLLQGSGCEAGERGRAFYTTLGELEAAWIGVGADSPPSFSEYAGSGCGRMWGAQSVLDPRLVGENGNGSMLSAARAAQAPLPPTWSCSPSGVIFHQTRTGSTLMANMVGSLNYTLMFSEPQPPQAIVRARRLTFTAKVRWLRVVLGSMSRPIHAAMRGLNTGQFPGWNPVAVYVKTQHTSVLWADVYRAAFPSTPWVFVHREPTEILMSMLRSRLAPLPNASMDTHLPEHKPKDFNSSTPCLRSRTWQLPLPALITRAAAAHDPDYNSTPGITPFPPYGVVDAARALGRSVLARVHSESWCALDLAHVAAAALKHAVEARLQALHRMAWYAAVQEHKHGAGHSGPPPPAYAHSDGPTIAEPTGGGGEAALHLPLALGLEASRRVANAIHAIHPTRASPAMRTPSFDLDLRSSLDFGAVMAALAPGTVHRTHGDGHVLAASFPSKAGTRTASTARAAHGAGSVLGVGLPVFIAYTELPGALLRLMDGHFAAQGQFGSGAGEAGRAIAHSKWPDAALLHDPSMYRTERSHNVSAIAEAALRGTAVALYGLGEGQEGAELWQASTAALHLFSQSFAPGSLPLHLTPQDILLLAGQTGQYSKARASAADLGAQHHGNRTSANGTNTTSSTPDEMTGNNTQSGARNSMLLQAGEGEVPAQGAEAQEKKKAKKSGPRLPFANVDADGHFIKDDGVKQTTAWPALQAAGQRYMAPLHEAMLAFSSPGNSHAHLATVSPIHPVLGPDVFAPRGALTAAAAVSLMGGTGPSIRMAFHKDVDLDVWGDDGGGMSNAASAGRTRDRRDRTESSPTSPDLPLPVSVSALAKDMFHPAAAGNRIADNIATTLAVNVGDTSQLAAVLASHPVLMTSFVLNCCALLVSCGWMVARSWGKGSLRGGRGGAAHRSMGVNMTAGRAMPPLTGTLLADPVSDHIIHGMHRTHEAANLRDMVAQTPTPASPAPKSSASASARARGTPTQAGVGSPTGLTLSGSSSVSPAARGAGGGGGSRTHTR